MHFRNSISSIYLVLAMLLGSSTWGQLFNSRGIVVEVSPSENQVYQRNANDQCYVRLYGKYTGKSPLMFGRETRPRYNENYVPLNVFPITIRPDSTFEILFTIHAELREWKVALYAGRKKVYEVANITCGDVYAVLGQSNATSDLSGPEANYLMNGSLFNTDYQDRYARALGEGIWGLEAAKPSEEWRGWGPAGAVYYDQYHAGGWPLKLQHDLIQEHKIPIGIINAAFSGSSIQDNLKNSSAIAVLEGTTGTVHGNPEQLNIFQYFMKKVERAGVKNSLKYVFWYQGESDVQYATCTQNYFDLLGQLTNDIKSELPTVSNIFLFQLHTSCTSGLSPQSYKLKEAQRQFSLQNDDVHLIPTTGVQFDFMATAEIQRYGETNSPCHFNRLGMEFLAERVFPLLSTKVYNSTIFPIESVVANQIQSAHYAERSRDLKLTFTYPIALNEINDGSANHLLKDYFYDQDKDPLDVELMVIKGNELTLKLRNNVRLKSISMYPASFYHNTHRNYYGPWLESENGSMGVPIFADFPISHVQVHKGVFNKTWSNNGDGKLGQHHIMLADIILSGNYDEDEENELMVIDSSGTISVFDYNFGTWKSSYSHRQFVNRYKSTFITLDVNGDSISELIQIDSVLTLYAKQDTHFIKALEIPLKELKVDATVMATGGDFDGNRKDDLLLITENKSIILEFKTEITNLLSWSSTEIELPNENLSWRSKTKFYTGDFDNDGKDEVLSTGLGVVLFKLSDYRIQLIWSATADNNFKGFSFPLEKDSVKIIVSDIDPSKGGDELVIINHQNSQQGIGVFSFNQEKNMWNYFENMSSKDPTIGDWPILYENGRNVHYYIFNSNQDSSSLLSFKAMNCKDLWQYDIGLYNFQIRLEQSKIEYKTATDKIFRIYPNPASQYVWVSSQVEQKEFVSVEIINSAGMLIQQLTERFTPEMFPINLSGFSSGLYFIRIKSAKGVESHSLIVP